MDTFDVSPVSAFESDTLPAPPDVIHVPAVAAGAKRKGRPAKVSPPSMSLFAAVIDGSDFRVVVDHDSDDGLHLRLQTVDCLLSLHYNGPQDGTLAPQLRLRKGYRGADDVEGPHDITPTRSASLSAEGVIAALDHVAPAMSTDVTRYGLCGVYFDTDGTWVATDGHRLHSHSGMATPFLKGAIIPAFAINLLQRAIKATKAESVRIEWLSETVDRAEGVRFTVEGASLRIAFRARLVDAQFPNYRQVIPSTDNAHAFTVDAKEARSVIASAPVIGDRMTGRDFSFNDEGVTTYRHDKRPSRIPCQYLSGCNADVRLNAKYVDQALSECEGATTFYVGADDLTPITITNDRRLVVIMPLRK